mmetsp:Transcript_24359/g.61396  ORF Transcript_24359/g.61396 Transcript_24359/m.61396 type:complete len:200 (+) Transcript_24359:31-630(+)
MALPDDGPPPPPQAVIFLDCDGVLATSRCLLLEANGADVVLHEEDKWCPMERRCLGELARVVNTVRETHAGVRVGVVLSTTWRRDPDQRQFLVSALTVVGVEVVGDTPVLSSRGEEVMAWLGDHATGTPSGGVKAWIVLDDDKDRHGPGFEAFLSDPSRVVWTILRDVEAPWKEGLTKDAADVCIEKLVGQLTASEAAK